MRSVAAVVLLVAGTATTLLSVGFGWLAYRRQVATGAIIRSDLDRETTQAIEDPTRNAALLLNSRTAGGHEGRG
jgi:hypothetical protein